MEKASRAVVPGSFDPPTNGHLDIIRRAADIFDKVLVAVLYNSEKSSLLSTEERVALIRGEVSDLGGRVEVHMFSGLLVDFARLHGVNIIVRGLRAITDYEYEAQMALMNRSLNDSIETVFFIAREEHSYISSSMVKQVASLGGSVSRFVPPAVETSLKRHFSKVNS